MKHIYLISFSILTTLYGFTQDTTEYLKHFASIDTALFLFETEEDSVQQMKREGKFIQYIIENNLEKEEHKKFISNRNLLSLIRSKGVDKQLVYFEDSLLCNKSIKCSIRFGDFQKNENEISRESNKNYIESINGFRPYGASYLLPAEEITSLEILINGKVLEIPDSAFVNLYDINKYKNSSFEKRIEIYESLDGHYIYLYLFGGNAADTYFAKLIFNHKKYVGRIIADYYSLSIHASFGPHFIGF